MGTLVRARATFWTGNEEKDHDTIVRVKVSRTQDNALVAEGSHVGKQFPDLGFDGFDLQVYTKIDESEYLMCATDVSIEPKGSDTWRFDYELYLEFASGSGSAASRTVHNRFDRIELRKDHAVRRFPLYKVDK